MKALSFHAICFIDFNVQCILNLTHIHKMRCVISIVVFHVMYLAERSFKNYVTKIYKIFSLSPQIMVAPVTII